MDRAWVIFLHGPNKVNSIQFIILLARVVLRVKGKRRPSLESRDSIELPTLCDLLQGSFVMDAVCERQFPNPTDDEALGSVEVGERAIQPIVVWIGVLVRTSAESGTQVNRLRKCIRGTKLNAFTETLIHS